MTFNPMNSLQIKWRQEENRGVIQSFMIPCVVKWSQAIYLKNKRGCNETPDVKLKNPKTKEKLK